MTDVKEIPYKNLIIGSSKNLLEFIRLFHSVDVDFPLCFLEIICEKFLIQVSQNKISTILKLKLV